MLNFNEQLIRTLQGQYTDYDILREKPFVIVKGDYHMVFKPCTLFEHNDFMSDTYEIINRWGDFFNNLDLLNYNQIQDQEKKDAYIEKLQLFNIKQLKKRTVQDIAKYVQTWGKVYTITSKGLKEVPFENSILKEFTIDELITAFSALIIFNEEIPKKKVFQTLDRIRKVTGLGNYSGTSSKGVTQFPKWEDLPLSKSG